MSEIIQKIPAALRKAAYVESSGNIMMPAMRLMYGSFFTPVKPSKKETDPKKRHWTGTGLIPAGFDISVLNKAIDDILAENLTEAKRKPLSDGSLPYNHPVLNTAKKNSFAEYADEYPFHIKANTKEFTRDGKKRPAPQVLDPKGNDVTEEMEPDAVYNGRWFRMTVQPFWYPASEGKAGVSLGLVNVQLLYNDDPLAGGKAKASQEFSVVEIDEEEDEMAEIE